MVPKLSPFHPFAHLEYRILAKKWPDEVSRAVFWRVMKRIGVKPSV